jgi:pimeloyl-ACP methyl ester carboxylesterase
VIERLAMTVAGRRVTGLRRRGSGMPTLLVHGAGRTHASLAGLASALEGPVIAPSLPGRDGSEGPPLATAAEMAGWLEVLLAALGVSETRIVGHSLGGGVALEMVLRGAPVRALGLVSTGARLRVAPALLEAVRAAAGAGAANPIGDPSVAASTALADWEAANAFDRLGALGGLRLPTWVAVGAEDRLTPPRYAEYLAQHLTGALRIFPDVGHELPSSCPEALAAWLFLQQNR